MIVGWLRGEVARGVAGEQCRVEEKPGDRKEMLEHFSAGGQQ